MKISLPPTSTNTDFNLTKQKQVFDLCFDSELDYQLDSGLPERGTLACFEVAHSPLYIKRVCAQLKPNGFADLDHRKTNHASQSVAQFITATLAALDRVHDGQAVAFAPVSGFHHAGYDHGGGFCTFNGLCIAAGLVRTTMKKVDKILILDGDGHYGDGTEDIRSMLGWKGWLANWWIGRDNRRAWQDLLSRQLDSVDLVIYQAGADAHHLDPFGVGTLTDGEWLQRDRFIFESCRLAGVPIVWCLAGGYNGAKTIDLHTSTFTTACEVFYPDVERKAIPRAATQDHPDAFQGGL